MAVYPISCADAKLVMDTDKDTITITRANRFQTNMPKETVIKLSEVTAIEEQYLTYGIEKNGSGAIKFIYPGCKPGGDLTMGFVDHENIIQYKQPARADALKLLAALKPIAEENKKRLS
jgi:hypothetical protein